MSVRLNPYLAFRDTARQAMEFYQSVLGGELTVSTFAEFGASEDPSEAAKVMHSALATGDDLLLMAADTPNSMDHTPGSGHSISLSGDEDARLRGVWEKLCDGGTVTVPLEQAPWGDTFGMCVDRFGVSWLVNITAASD